MLYYNGKSYRNVLQPIFCGSNRIHTIYVGDKLVYPDVNIEAFKYTLDIVERASYNGDGKYIGGWTDGGIFQLTHPAPTVWGADARFEYHINIRSMLPFCLLDIGTKFEPDTISVPAGGNILGGNSNKACKPGNNTHPFTRYRLCTPSAIWNEQEFSNLDILSLPYYCRDALCSCMAIIDGDTNVNSFNRYNEFDEWKGSQQLPISRMDEWKWHGSGANSSHEMHRLDGGIGIATNPTAIGNIKSISTLHKSYNGYSTHYYSEAEPGGEPLDLNGGGGVSGTTTFNTPSDYIENVNLQLGDLYTKLAPSWRLGGVRGVLPWASLDDYFVEGDTSGGYSDSQYSAGSKNYRADLFVSGDGPLKVDSIDKYKQYLLQVIQNERSS